MNERVRLRVLRNFVASILMSNLNKVDMIEIVEELSYGDLGRELGVVLRDAVALLPDPPSERFSQPAAPKPPYEALAYDIVQRRKIGKKSLVEAMGAVAPRLLKNDLPTGTIREMLEWFFDIATPSQSLKLLSLLSDGEQDQYLKGIARRS